MPITMAVVVKLENGVRYYPIRPDIFSLRTVNNLSTLAATFRMPAYVCDEIYRSHIIVYSYTRKYLPLMRKKGFYFLLIISFTRDVSNHFDCIYIF